MGVHIVLLLLTCCAN